MDISSIDFSIIDFSSVEFANARWVLFLPCALMAIDVILGVIHAWVTRHLKSYRMREGLGRKAGEMAILVIAGLFTLAFNLPMYIIGFFSLYIIIMELVSICENVRKLGIPIPKFIDRALGEIKNKIQNGSDDDGGEGASG